MKTKLVYVLTCDSEDHYIEQALISVYSARYWNPDASIILLVDDKTDELLIGSRSEILRYISEKKVITIDDENLSMSFRSRFIKTDVRRIISGDFLFIDCDTIVCKPLYDIDNFKCDVGAVPESMLPVKEFCDSLYERGAKRCKNYGYNISELDYYFCSGVIYAKDTEQAHNLYALWNKLWLEGYQHNGFADQPPLGKANLLTGGIIKRIPDSYDNIVFTQDINIKEAHILHISSYRNPSYLFSKRVLSFIRNNGIQDNNWLISSILNPEKTILPYDYFIKNSSLKEKCRMITSRKEFLFGYAQNVDCRFNDFPMNSRAKWIVVFFLRLGLYQIGLAIWILWKSNKLRNITIPVNICAKII